MRLLCLFPLLLLAAGCSSVRLPVLPLPTPPLPVDSTQRVAIETGFSLASNLAATAEARSTGEASPTWSALTARAAFLSGPVGLEATLLSSVDEALDDFSPTGFTLAPVLRQRLATGATLSTAPHFVASSGYDNRAERTYDALGVEVPLFATWTYAHDQGAAELMLSVGAFGRLLSMERSGARDALEWMRVSGGALAGGTLRAGPITTSMSLGFEHTLENRLGQACPLGADCEPGLPSGSSLLLNLSVGFTL